MSKFESKGGVSEEDIESAEVALRWMLPLDYREFQMKNGGGEGFLGENFLILWGVNELAEFNRDYEVEEYAPGLIVFGSDGAGDAFAFDTRFGKFDVVRVPFIGMGLESAVPVADSFDKFMKKMDS